MRANTSCFSPDWASPPGDTILDVLQERSIALDEFASRLRWPIERAQRLIDGSISINLDTARALECMLGASVEFWIDRDHQYWADRKRIDDANGVWLEEAPLKEAVAFGWIAQEEMAGNDPDEVCARFFDLPTVEICRQKYSLLEHKTAFRRSLAYETISAAVAFWLRQGEIEAAKVECKNWSRDGFRDSLAEVRKLTLIKDPKKFLPRLQGICAESGVAVVLVRAPKGCRTSGATRFLEFGRPGIFLSGRYGSDDHFWFTFFHEAGHLILHDEEQMFLEGIGDTSDYEKEANEFAARILIPEQYRGEMLDLPWAYKDVLRFAQRIKVAPGIVVGQMQHEGVLPHGYLEKLKRRYKWFG